MTEGKIFFAPLTWAPSYASNQYFPPSPKMQSALRLTLLVEWGRGEGVRSCSWKPPHGWAPDLLWHSHYRSNDNSNQPIYFKLQTNSTISLRVIQSSTIPTSFSSCSSLVQTLQYRSYQQLMQETPRLPWNYQQTDILHYDPTTIIYVFPTCVLLADEIRWKGQTKFVWRKERIKKSWNNKTFLPNLLSTHENIVPVFLPAVWCAYAMIASETNFCQTSCSVHPSSLLTGIK